MNIREFIDYSSFCIICQTNEHNKWAIKGCKKIKQKHKLESDNSLNVKYKLLTLTIRSDLSFEFNDIQAFFQFNIDNILYISSKCKKCHSFVESNHLVFDYVKKQLNSIIIDREMLKFNHEGILYQFIKHYVNNESILSAFKIIKGNYFPIGEYYMPILHGSMKNKQQILDYYNTLANF